MKLVSAWRKDAYFVNWKMGNWEIARLGDETWIYPRRAPVTLVSFSLLLAGLRLLPFFEDSADLRTYVGGTDQSAKLALRWGLGVYQAASRRTVIEVVF